MNIGKFLYGSRAVGHKTWDVAVRLYIRKKYKDRCFYCERKYNPKLAQSRPYFYFDKIEIDHVIPFSKSGRNHISNYVLACRECNRRKSDRVLAE